MKKLQFEINDQMIELIPQANQADRQALKLDITHRWEVLGEDKVLLQSILLGPDGRVVDGRTRLEILSELGLEVPKDKIERMPYGTTDEQVIMAVRSANMRRNLTTTQKVFMSMRAYLLEKSNKKKVTLSEFAKSFGIGTTTLKNALYINKVDKTTADKLWAGYAIDVISQDNQVVSTSSVNTICQYLKRQEESSVLIACNKNEWSSEANIKTQAGKDWYYKQIKMIKTDCPITKMRLAELANYKFTTDNQSED